ncbi:MAG: carbonic anhydrase [Bacteroidales bacterium]|nr:carbonic anhydrase [Bacteroidales bacterium]
MIEDILKFNRQFVDNKAYEPFITDKYPDKKLAVLSCMDTRLSLLLPAALGLKNGDAKIIKNAGGIILHPFDSAVRSLIVAIYELGVEEVMVIAHSNCGACHMNGPEIKAEMLKKGITQEVIDTIQHSGFDLDEWLEGFHDTVESVRKTVACLVNHPLIPKSVRICGFIIDSVTGALTPIVYEPR